MLGDPLMMIERFKVILKYITAVSLISLLCACATNQSPEQRDASYTKEIREVKLSWSESKEFKTKLTVSGSAPVITDYHKQLSRNNITRLLHLMRVRGNTEIGTRLERYKIAVINDSSRKAPTIRLASSEGITACQTATGVCVSSIIIDVSLHDENDQKPIWNRKLYLNDGGHLQTNTGGPNGNSTTSRYMPNDLELLEKLTDQIAPSLTVQRLIVK
jgi:hypothetical protein